MTVLVISQDDVVELLPMHECIEAVAGALGALAEGRALQPLRPVMWLPERVGALGLMPGYLADAAVMGVKAVSVFPGNEGTEFDSHQGVVLLFETGHGRLLAIVDATEVTAIRTAAVSGLATRLLSRPEASTLALLGSGTQARTHLAAMREVRPIRRVLLWSRDSDHAARLADTVTGPSVGVVTSVREAVEEADIVCTTTSAPTPILEGSWLAPGTHINAIGSSVPFTRELDGTAVERSRLFVDRRESTLAEAGEFLLAREEGRVDADDIVAELGDVVVDRHPGREDDQQITLFKATGLAVEDVASVDHVYHRAVETGRGTHIDLGGLRRDG